ncbi:MAG: helix-turn-helix transcriptional regulator [bacterium]|nr:helix-turn-helix transcriptional regulator [bacterium]
MMKMYYAKPPLKNLSQGARLKYIRKHRHMSTDDVAEYFGFGGKDPHKTFNSYENNYREPSEGRLKEIAELYNVLH